MISFIFNFLICAIFLSKNNQFKDNDESIYSLTAISLLISFAINGLLGLTFIFLKITYLPLFIFSASIFILMISNVNLRRNLIFLKNICVKESIQIFDLYKKSNFIKLVFIFLFLLLLVSLGPINHSDAANAYVGYPYKFWLKNQHFIDGDLNQGLLGLGDFSNIFYFQDRTIWLIRFTEFLPLIPILFLILRRKTNKIIVYTIMSTPVFIQWMSIGKNNFFSDACVVIIFLVWEKNKDKRDLLFLISASLISISFKVSSILICFPIYLFIIYFYRYQISKINFKEFFDFVLSFPLLIAILSLITIFSYRFYLHQNPFYPLLTSFFNPGDKQLSDWETLLKGWNRTTFFQLWIFIPKSIGKISFVLGPANLILFLFYSFVVVNKKRKKIRTNTILGISQFILLLLFAQGRADYYVSPILLTYVGVESIDLPLTKNNFVKKIISFVLIMQLFMFIASSIYLIYTNFLTIKNYENGMDKIAWNFYNSRVIAEKAVNPVLNEATGMTHLFFKEDFISNNAFGKCLYYNEDDLIKNKYYYCVKKLGVKTIIVDKNKLGNDKNFSCTSQELIRVSRNIFLTKKKEVDFCSLK